MRKSVLIAVLFCLAASVPSAAGTPAADRVTAAAKLMDLLKNSGSSKVRVQAALGLGSFNDVVASTDALVAALRDSDAKVRGAAAKSLKDQSVVAKFDVIAEFALKEADPFASRWIEAAVVRIAGAASELYLGVDGLRCVDCYESDQAVRNFQTGFLVYILAKKGYNVSAALDFSPDDSLRQRSTGGAIDLVMKGGLVTTGDARSAGATVDASAAARCGFVVWKGTVSVADVGPGATAQEDDRFADEFTIRDEPEDARLVAATQVGMEVGIRFDADLRKPGADNGKK